MKTSSQPVQRPVWLVFISIAAGIALVAGIIALAAHYFFYAVFIFTILIGATGGIFGWLWADRFGFPATRMAGLAGAVCGLGIYGLYRYFEYLLFHGTLETGISLSFWEYTSLMAENGLSFSRRPSSGGIVLADTLVWLYWAIEVLIVTGLSGWIAGQMNTYMNTAAK